MSGLLLNLFLILLTKLMAWLNSAGGRPLRFSGTPRAAAAPEAAAAAALLLSEEVSVEAAALAAAACCCWVEMALEVEAGVEACGGRTGRAGGS